ncbi:MAG: alpha/beta hydrolase [candidate division Zixibacteria bacterium]|nr:alpha/beta hydrolase [candidate division Zixibacteria bacterium]
METGFTEVNGTKLYYEVMGEGYPVVLIPAGKLDRRMWDDQFEVFAKHHKVLRYDMRGYGKSEMSQRPYSDVEDLCSLLKFLNIDKACLIGVSVGGKIAIDFTLAYPEMVYALIPISADLSGWNWSWSDEIVQKYQKIIETARDESESKAVEMWLEFPLFAPAMQNPTIAPRIRKMVQENSHLFLMNPLLRRELKPPAMQRLSEIRVPTLIISGERDVSNFIDIADTLEKNIAGAKKIVIFGAGHLVSMEKPEQFNRIVLDFLSTQVP